MKTVICKSKGANASISENSVYTVVEETDTRYALVNDKGVQKNYSKKLFTEQVARRAARAAVPVMEVAPPPPPAPIINIINELDIQIDTTIDDGAIESTVTLVANDDLFRLEQGFTTQLTGSDISCGIHQVNGLNGIFANLNTIRTAIGNVLSPTLVLAEDINVDEVLNALFETLLQEILDASPRTSMLLFSTNVTNNQWIRESYIEKLDGISSYNVTTTNPNSNNDIKLWTVLMNE